MTRDQKRNKNSPKLSLEQSENQTVAPHLVDGTSTFSFDSIVIGGREQKAEEKKCHLLFLTQVIRLNSAWLDGFWATDSLGPCQPLGGRGAEAWMFFTVYQTEHLWSLADSWSVPILTAIFASSV